MRILQAYIILLALLSALPLQASENEDAWLPGRAKAQLQRDPTSIPKGKGMLFVPAMTTGDNEPNYQIRQNNSLVKEPHTGEGVVLSPGMYDLMIGSGTTDQMTREEVEIVEGFTTLVRPWWAGLVVDVIDETRTSINESYELFRDEGQENFGQGFGVEEERGEAVDTWLLKPGNYTVLKVGENISTTRKFSVRLLSGELIQRNLVVDNNSDFIGLYNPSVSQRVQQALSNWTSSWELSMSPQFNTTQNTTGEDRASLNFSGQIRNRSRYNSEKHFADIRFIIEEGFTKEEGDALRKSVDKFEIRTTYIFRLSRVLGPYLRGVMQTKLFPHDQLFDEPQTLTLLDANNNVTERRSDVTEFGLEPSFFPLDLRQGFGINSQVYRSFPLNIDLRIGLGARQNIVSYSFELLDAQSVREIENASSTGLEALIIMDARWSRYFSMDSEFDILMPSPKTGSWEFAFENRVRTFLTPFINMDIVFDFAKQKPLNRLQSSQQVLLRFVKIF